MSEPNKLDEYWEAAMPDLAEAAEKAGIDPGIMAKIAGFESHYNAHARPIAGAKHLELNTVIQFDGSKAMSSAYGYGQFLNRTWAGMVREYGEKYGVLGATELTDAQTNTAELRNNTKLQAGVLAEFTRMNIEKGNALGGADPAANVYAMHNLGGGDGPAFLKALAHDGSKRVDSVLSADVIKRNPALYADGSISLETAYKKMGAEMERYQRYADDITHAPKVAPTPQDATHEAPAHAATRQETTTNPAVLKEGSRGDDVEVLQNRLNKLGYTDAKGHALKADGHFGPATTAAVEAFQEKNRLDVDGVVGPSTQTRLDRAQEVHAPTATKAIASPAAARLDQEAHPANGMFKQAFSGMVRVDQQQGRTSDGMTSNIAGCLVVAAQREGMHTIDQVALSKDASTAFAIQGEANSPFKKHASVDVLAGINTPLEQSSADAITQVQASAPELAHQQQQTQARAQAQKQGQQPRM
jgi:peptidoglycan hydrolase-like protein with peptidoglycan-binding domain